jgi:hypothetical protein
LRGKAVLVVVVNRKGFIVEGAVLSLNICNGLLLGEAVRRSPNACDGRFEAGYFSCQCIYLGLISGLRRVLLNPNWEDKLLFEHIKSRE